MTEPFQITRELVTKIHDLLDYGLVKGKGVQKPGKMCIEAVVCAALGLPHSDNPPCVAQSLRYVKMGLNDAEYSSNKARAKALERLAIAQLGTAGTLNEPEFATLLAKLAITTAVPTALRAAASIHPSDAHRAALLLVAERCEMEGTSDAASAASDAASAASAASAARAASAASDVLLADFAEGVVQILVEMKAPGTEWLDFNRAA